MQDLLITLHDRYAGDTQSVADKLSAQGLQVTQVLPIGVISGRAKAGMIERLRAVKEVATVDEDNPVRVAPPHQDVQ